MIEHKRKLCDELAAMGFMYLRMLPDGRLIGVYRFMYTYGLCVGIQMNAEQYDAYQYRYCYAQCKDAAMAATTWDGTGDPPGPWIKLKGHPDRPDALGPGAKEL